MRGNWFLVVVIGLALAAPIVPFLLWGSRLEPAIESWLQQRHSPWLIAAAVIGLLSVDVALPIPSSFVSTYAGAELGMVAATIVSWLGMTLGASIAFAMARVGGRAAGSADLEGMETAARRLGARLLVLTRALPILAEASVLALGALGLSWRRFFPAVALSNLGIAAIYSVFGALAREKEAVIPAMAASVVVPLAAAALVRWRWSRPLAKD